MIVIIITTAGAAVLVGLGMYIESRTQFLSNRRGR